MRPIEAIVLAGGFGKRMGPMYCDEQKCLLPVEGKPLLGYIMDNLQAAFGSVDLIVGIGYKGASVKDFVLRNLPPNTKAAFAPHVPGTEGWGIYLEMKKYINGPFVATPGDIVAHPGIYENTLYQYEANHTVAAMTISSNLWTADTHGVGVADDGMMTDLQWPPPPEIPVGYKRDVTIWASDTAFFDVITCYRHPGQSIGFVFTDAVRDGQPIIANDTEKPWFHLGYPRDLLKTEAVRNIIADVVHMG